MAYRTVQEVLAVYLKKYEITRAIIRAQQCKAAAKKQKDYDFWLEVEQELLQIKKQNKEPKKFED